MDQVLEQLKGLKSVRPNSEWVKTSREVLLNQIKVQQSQKTESFSTNVFYFIKSILPGKMLSFVVKPIGVLSVFAIFLVCSGAFGVNASRGSLPGDLLYGVKLTSEKVKVGLTLGADKQAEMHIAFAEERVNEITTIAKSGQDQRTKKQQVQIATDLLKEDMVKAQDKLNNVKAEMKNSNDDQSAKLALVMSVGLKTEEISAKLNQQKNDLNNDKDISKSLSDAVDVVDETGVRAVEVVVEKHDNGAVNVSEKDLVDTVGKKIENTEKKATEIPLANESTKEVVAPQKENAEKAVNTVIKEKQAQAKQLLVEAKELLNQGDLTAAMEKVKQSAEITKEVKAALAALEEQAQVVPAEIPVVTVPVEPLKEETNK